MENIKETSREGGELIFPQFADDAPLLRGLKALLVQSQNFVFSTHPLSVVALLGVSVWLLLRRRVPHAYVLFFCLLLPFVFILGGLFSGVFVNPRYEIMIYPFIALLTAIALVHALLFVKKQRVTLSSQRLIFCAAALIVVTHMASLWHIKPHYFNYESFLLPKDYVVTDAWGYGLYEAAAFLNEQPNAENLVIWADRAGICQFFVGKCIRSHKIELAHTIPDYFVFSRRGMIRKRFAWGDFDPDRVKPQEYYYSKDVLENPAWELTIGGRSPNFIKVIRVEN